MKIFTIPDFALEQQSSHNSPPFLQVVAFTPFNIYNPRITIYYK